MRAKKILKEPSSVSGDEGSRVHALIEEYFLNDKWNDELLPYKRLLNLYKEKGGRPEAEYAFKWVVDVCDPEYDSKKLVRCEMDDPNCWFRAILDWVKVDGEFAEVADWKTGKVKPTKQLQFYAWVIMLAHPEVKKVKGTFHWINYKDQLSDQFTREQFEEGVLFEPFHEKLSAIDQCYETDEWRANPGQIGKQGRGWNCTFCLVTKDHCEYGVTQEQYDRKHQEAQERQAK